MKRITHPFLALATTAVVAWMPLVPAGPVAPAPQEAPLGDAPPLAALELPLEKLGAWGRRELTYTVTKGGSRQTLGAVVLTTSVADGVVTLTDRVDLDFRGAPFWLEVTATGPLDNELRPDKLIAKGTTDDGDGKTFELVAEFGPSSASVNSNSRSKSVQVPPGAVSDAALLRLVTLLPRRAGVLARFEHLLDASEMLVKPGGTIACSGPEGVEIDGKSRETWRFDVTSGDRVFLSAWVDGEGRLMKVLWDGYKEWTAKG